jgi:hypothetical protein
MARVEGVERPGFSFAAVVYFMVKRKLGHVVRPLRIHALSPPILRGYALMEDAQESARAVPKGLKKLAQIRVATRVGCPF